MKWRMFIAKAEALGFHCEATVLDNNLLTRMLVINRKGDEVASIENMSAYNYDVRYWWAGSSLYDSEEQHRQLVLLVQQVGDTKIQNRGILPAYVQQRQFEVEHEATV
jgi:hypothetical protein